MTFCRPTVTESNGIKQCVCVRRRQATFSFNEGFHFSLSPVTSMYSTCPCAQTVNELIRSYSWVKYRTLKNVKGYADSNTRSQTVLITNHLLFSTWRETEKLYNFISTEQAQAVWFKVALYRFSYFCKALALLALLHSCFPHIIKLGILPSKRKAGRPNSYLWVAVHSGMKLWNISEIRLHSVALIFKRLIKKASPNNGHFMSNISFKRGRHQFRKVILKHIKKMKNRAFLSILYYYMELLSVRAGSNATWKYSFIGLKWTREWARTLCANPSYCIWKCGYLVTS